MAQNRSKSKSTSRSGGKATGTTKPNEPTSPVGTQQEPQLGADGVNAPAADPSTEENSNVTTSDQNGSETVEEPRRSTLGTDKSNVNGPVDGNVEIQDVGPAEGTTMATNEGVINEHGDKAGEGTVGEYEEAGIPTGGLRTGVAGHEEVSPYSKSQTPRQAADQEQAEGTPEHTVAEPKGKILRNGEETTFSGEVVGNTVIVKEDVYREVYPFRSKRPTYVLVYAKGTGVPVTSLQALGVNVEDTTADDESDEK